jgi:hypothetical protein
MKASLLVAMLTGRVFHARWEEPFPLHALARPERIDWRLPTNPPLPRADAGGGVHLPPPPPTPDGSSAVGILCLPFATAPRGGECGNGLRQLQSGDLRKAYAHTQVLEVHTFTDLNIYLSTNPHYEQLLARLGATCPKRMGCLYDFLFSPTELVTSRLDATLAPHSATVAPSPSPSPPPTTTTTPPTPTPPPKSSPPPPPHAASLSSHVGVQVRNRLWRAEALKPSVRADNRPERVLRCMDRYVPPGATVFFTADDDSFYEPARRLWGDRMRAVLDGGVFEPWSRGSKVDPVTLGEDSEAAMLKAFVDWFALRRAGRLVYTHQSSFGKTAAEANDAPNVDVNHTRCGAADARWSAALLAGAAAGDSAGSARAGSDADRLAAREAAWAAEWAAVSANGVTYDTSQVPGAK